MSELKDTLFSIFNDAAELPPAEQAAFVKRACGDDAALRQRVEDLLRATDLAGNFLENPVMLRSDHAGEMSHPLAENPGDIIDRYKLLERIGEGGFGVVYLAEQTEPVHRLVALKVIKLGMDTKAVIARFEAERQALAMMDHPHIAKVLDAGATATGRPYFVMELVKGSKITVYCDEHGLSTAKRLKLFISVCEAIQHAHQKGIIHRDIKPSNILVATVDGRPVPKVIDFGIAKATQGPLNENTVLTLFSQFIGTPDYMSPEQAQGLPDIDTRSDIYSLGVLLYQMLTGTTPFHLLKAGLEKIRQTILKEEPDRPSTRLSSLEKEDQTRVARLQQITPTRLLQVLKGELDWIILKTLEKDRERRYESAGALADDVDCYLNNRPVTARPPSKWYHAKKFARRHPAGLAFAGIILVLLIGLQAAFLITRALRVERDVALQVAALNDAQLAAKMGNWREALKHLDKAEKAGYADVVGLGLMRADAWTALNQPDKSGAELYRLVRRPDLGKHAGTVLLKMGDHELFDKTMVDQGMQHVREAISNNLTNADLLIAEGLLTNSVPDALGLFQRALQADPYSHAAYVHCMGLEFVLGHHSDLASHIRVFSVLFPDDPSGRYLEATEYAFGGDFTKAKVTLEPLHQTMSEDAWAKLVRGYEDAADAAACFDVDTLATSGAIDTGKLNELIGESGTLMRASFEDTEGVRLREPHLPCLEYGLLDGATALQALASPFYADAMPAIEKLKQCLRLCPEAVLPFRAATLLEDRQPHNAPASLPLREIQAELYQMAADTPSFLPQVPRASRYFATRIEFELIQDHATNMSWLRENCRRNLRMISTSEPSLVECAAYFPMAFQMSDYDPAKQLLDCWEKAAPDDTNVTCNRIELETVAGNFGTALQLIDDLSIRSPNDFWLNQSRDKLIKQLQDLLHSSATNTNHYVPLLKRESSL